MSKYAETRRVKKNLPYTVSNIECLEYWRKERAEIEAKWQVKKEIKRQDAIMAFNLGRSQYDDQKSKTTEIYQRYQKQQQENLQRYAESIQPETKSNKRIQPETKTPAITPKDTQKYSKIFTLFYVKFVNWLISLKF